MALNDAIKLLNRIKDNNAFRGSLYLCDSPNEVENHIRSLGYYFTHDELEDSYRSLLLKCQFEDEANLLTEVYTVFRMLMGMSPVFTP